MKRFLLFIAWLFISSELSAQSVTDMLKLSDLSYRGTARSAAMAGAFGALGGDVGVWSLNPGGIGVFRKSEVNYTSVLHFSEVKSGDRSGKKTSYLAGSFGGVLSCYKDSEYADWKGFNLGISYTDMNNFNRKIRQAITDSPTSLTDVYAAQSQGLQPEELDIFTTGPFYDTYLLYQDDEGLYHSVLETADHPAERVNQYCNIDEKGYLGEVAFAGGTNYKDKLYLGMTLGIQWVLYKKHRYYTEVAEENAPSQLDFYNFNEYQRTKGAGINLKLGVIYRPVPLIRLGAAIHTPTWYTLEHLLESSVDAHFTTTEDPSIGREAADYQISSTVYDEYYDPYRYLSDLRTPWRAILSFGTVLGRRLMVDVDYEYVNYRAAKYTRPNKWAYDDYDDDWEKEKVEYLSKSMDYSELNKAIKDLYRSAHNFRLGAELRLNSMVSLRGGYAFQESPFAGNRAGHNEVRTASGGLGLNFGIVYGDISYAHHKTKSESCFYEYGDVHAAPILHHFRDQEIRLTIGVRLAAVEDW